LERNLVARLPMRVYELSLKSENFSLLSG